MWKNYITEPEAHLVPKARIFSRNFLKTLPRNRVVGFSVPHFASPRVPPHNPTSQSSKLISKVQILPHFFANCFTPEPTRANTQGAGDSGSKLSVLSWKETSGSFEYEGTDGENGSQHMK
ncbi:hypothetical protein ACE6H2_022107 [Prunus campanulata]